MIIVTKTMAEILSNEDARKKCHSAKKLTDEEIQERMKTIGDGWTIHEGKLTNIFFVGNKKRDSFSKAFSFARLVAQLAEQYCHHPEIIIKWGSCEVSFWTHSIGGLSVIDFEMADRVYEAFDNPLHLYPTSFNEARTSTFERRYSLPQTLKGGTYGSSPDPRKKQESAFSNKWKLQESDSPPGRKWGKSRYTEPSPPYLPHPH